MGMKSEIKQKIIRFWKEHRDFDDRRPSDIRAAEELYRELRREYSEMEIIEAVEELRDEAEKAVEKAREKFLEELSEKVGMLPEGAILHHIGDENGKIQK